MAKLGVLNRGGIFINHKLYIHLLTTYFKQSKYKFQLDKVENTSNIYVFQQITRQEKKLEKKEIPS